MGSVNGQDPDTDVLLPPYAYVPGQTPRHPETLFADLHRTVEADMSVDQLAATAAWRAGWVFLERGFFWESHEVLEPVWMQTRPNSAERHLVQAVIQVANAGLKARMGRVRAVGRLCDLAQTHLDASRRAGGEKLMQLRFDDLAERIDAFRIAAIR